MACAEYGGTNREQTFLKNIKHQRAIKVFVLSILHRQNKCLKEIEIILNSQI